MVTPIYSLDDALSRAINRWRSIRQRAVSVSTALNASVAATVILDLRTDWLTEIDEIDNIAGVPGIGAYAQANIPDGGSLDLATEWAATKAAMQAVIATIESEVPKDTSTNYLLVLKFTASGYEERTFSSSQTATLKSQIDAVIATLGTLPF